MVIILRFNYSPLVSNYYGAFASYICLTASVPIHFNYFKTSMFQVKRHSDRFEAANNDEIPIFGRTDNFISPKQTEGSKIRCPTDSYNLNRRLYQYILIFIIKELFLQLKYDWLGVKLCWWYNTRGQNIIPGSSEWRIKQLLLKRGKDWNI